MTIARWPTVKTGPVGEKIIQLLEFYPKKSEIYVTSGRDGDHGPVSYHYGLDYGGSPAAAIDIGAGPTGLGSVGDAEMRDLAKWIYDNLADLTVELIHSTPFADDDGFYVKNQVRNPGGSVYGGPQVIGHFDHVHWATSSALADLAMLRIGQAKPGGGPVPPVPTGVVNTAPVWGFDASNHDWDPDRGAMDLTAVQRDGISFFTHKASEGTTFKDPFYQEALERARGAGIPVLGAYHFLWPDDIAGQVDEWMGFVAEKTPWWKDVPWIWQVDAETEQGMPHPPGPDAILQTVNLVQQRMAAEGATGYVVVYAPRWLYRDSLTGNYDIWNSDYNGSGAARPFRDQYQGVTDVARGWDLMSGRKPRILQFASDATIGRQRTCDVDKFDGDLFALIRLCGREPVASEQGGPDRALVRSAGGVAVDRNGSPVRAPGDGLVSPSIG
ncbi:hypothetical protein GCM10023094_15860 [Rhodococcus olei]|uniref:GH25 family lysozyme M1 (1,4-beta-N-acetylmuramidase) n=1 Tax=Rhodococcus olei TaxID=2161675 RepID=A0ABP8NZT4_9NOCA